jgi:hypothetical protein
MSLFDSVKWFRPLGVVGILLFGSLGCEKATFVKDGGGKIRKVRVDHYLQPAVAVGPCLCMRVDEGEGPQVFYQGIEGFDFTWGTAYELTVRVEEVPDPPADGSSLRYTLVSVDKETKVPAGTRFGILVFDREFIRGESILSQRQFVYASGEVRRDLEKRLARLASGGVGFRVEFRHPDDPSKPLVLEKVSDAGR